MSDTSTSVFSPTAYKSDAWAMARDQLARPRTRDASWEAVREELAVRDLLSRYSYCWDQGDLDASMQCFTDDCVVSNPRGTVRGFEAVRADYEHHLGAVPRRFHLWTSVVVRLSDDLRSGRLTANFYAVLEPDDEPARAAAGVVVDDVVKRDGEWKIQVRTTAIDLTVPLAPLAPAGPPT